MLVALRAPRWRRPALGSALAAERYCREIIVRNIEDIPANFTRFLLLARAGEAEAPGPERFAALGFGFPGGKNGCGSGLGSGKTDGKRIFGTDSGCGSG